MSKRPVVEFSQADADLAATLDNLDGAENYAGWIFSLLQPHLGESVLEVGAGHGTFTEKLAATSQRVVAGDASERCTDMLRKRFEGDERVQVYQGVIADAGSLGPFDTAVLLNVLEHIEDDDGALGQLHDLLSPGGRVALWVPAFEALYSDFDRRIGHYRRYRTTQLSAQLERAGFRVEECRYVNAVGSLAWLVLARWMRRTPTAVGPVKVYDKWFVPVLRQIERVVPVPVGQSVFAVGVKVANH